MGLFDSFIKKRTAQNVQATETNNPSQKAKDTSEEHQQETTTLINSLNEDLTCIVEVFKAHGCDVVSNACEIKMGYDTSWFSEYRVIKSDGIYLYREVCMGGYNLEKRLDCLDVSTSFLILCADMLLGMKYKKMICDSDIDYQAILQIMAKNKQLIDNSISFTDKTNFLVNSYNELIANFAVS